MPYLKPKLRNCIDKYGEFENFKHYLCTLELGDFLGALNYCVFSVVRKYIKENPKAMCYSGLSAIIGTLDCAKEEIRRRILNPYEDEKIQENGDVE